MSSIGFNIAAPASMSTPFSPVGKLAVGLENEEGKKALLPPVEELHSAAGLKAGEGDRSSEENALDKSSERENVQTNSEAEKQRQQADSAIVRQLVSRDREVRLHEQAHSSVGGRYVGSPSYTYKKGPNGVSYAVAGEVSIASPSGGSPEEQLRAAEQIRRAALAPADPSSQDRRVAAHASQIALTVRAEILHLKTQERLERAEEVKNESLGKVDEDSSEVIKPLRLASSLRIPVIDELITGDKLQAASNIGEGLDQLA